MKLISTLSMAMLVAIVWAAPQPIHGLVQEIQKNARSPTVAQAASPRALPQAQSTIDSDYWSGMTLSNTAGSVFATASAEWSVVSISNPTYPPSEIETWDWYTAQAVGINAEALEDGMLAAGTYSTVNMVDGVVTYFYQAYYQTINYISPRWPSISATASAPLSPASPVAPALC